MTGFSSAAYAGTVVHKRLTPKRHAFSYRVFALLLDVDEIDRLARDLRLFSRNRRNVLSFFDRDHGAGDGADIATHARGVLAGAGLSDCGARISLLCYPRVFGFVFNPLSVYFCHRSDGTLGTIIYEVSNTFRERKSYVIPVTAAGEHLVAQQCTKELYVSPFTHANGRYHFHVRPPGDEIVVGVDLRTGDTPTLKTHFRGTRRPLDDKTIVSLTARHPLMTLKVVAGIHLEAARLWLKGVPLVERHTSPAYSFTVVPRADRKTSHAV